MTKSNCLFALNMLFFALMISTTNCGFDDADEDTSACNIEVYSETSFHNLAAVAVDYPTLYAIGGDRVAVFDISDVENPEVISGNDSVFSTNDTPADALVDGDVLFVLGFHDLWAINVEDPNSDPDLMWNVQLTSVALSEFFKMGDIIYMVNTSPWGGDPVEPLVIYNTETDSVEEHLFESGNYDSIANDDRYIYAGFRHDNYIADKELLIIDAANSSELNVVANIPFEYWISGLAVNGQYLYVLSSPGFHVYSIEDPENPSEITQYDESSAFLRTAMVLEDFLYIPLDGSGNMNIYAVANPAKPLLAEYFSAPDSMGSEYGSNIQQVEFFHGADNENLLVIAYPAGFVIVSSCKSATD